MNITVKNAVGTTAVVELVTPGPQGAPGVNGVSAPIIQYLYDHVSDGLVYQGWADISAETTMTLWRIKRVTTVLDVVTVEWADSNQNYDNIWVNRASLTYGSLP